MDIAASFKAYYIVFGVFTGVYIAADRLSSGASASSVINQIVLCGLARLARLAALAALAAFAAGYMIGCPHLLYDSVSFRENPGQFTQAGNSDPAGWLRRILGSVPQMDLTWDLVNCSGLSRFIISLPVLMLPCLGIIDKSSRARAIAATAATLSQIYLCFFGSTFLGWYLFSVIFSLLCRFPLNR